MGVRHISIHLQEAVDGLSWSLDGYESEAPTATPTVFARHRGYLAADVRGDTSRALLEALVEELFNVAPLLDGA